RGKQPSGRATWAAARDERSQLRVPRSDHHRLLEALPHSTEVPVLVAGGGAVGLVTALELQSRGIQTLPIERNPGTTEHPKMDVTNSRSMEHFRRLGVAERIRDVAVPRGNRMDVV